MSSSPPLPDESEDHATLHAALAFVDEFELSDGDHESPSADLLGGLTLDDQPVISADAAATGGAPPSSSDASTASLSKRSSSTNRSRKRQKDELLYLRGVVDELESQLSTLKKGDSDAAASKQPTEPLAFVWEGLAARQYAQRQRAEVENVKLRTMLEEQIRVAKNLERLIKKRTMAEFLVPSSAKRVRMWKDSSVLDDLAVFDELMTAIDEMRTRVSEVFADERFSCKVPALREIQARNDDEYGTVVEVFDSRVAPFGMEEISDAVWHHMTAQAFDPHAFHDNVVEVSDSVLKREFGSTLDMPRMKGTFRGKIAARRFVENDKILVLWAALLDPEKIADMPMDGLLMRQRGWTLIRAPPPDFVRSDRPATLTQSYHLVIPDVTEEEGDQRRKVGTLTNFVLSSVEFHLEMGRQMIENLLLEDGWKTPSSASSPETDPSANALISNEPSW